MEDETYYRYGYLLAKLKELCLVSETNTIHEPLQRNREMRKILLDPELQRIIEEDYDDAE